jgi:TRAP-type C4-dicarboxylate transport system permease large subunit
VFGLKFGIFTPIESCGGGCCVSAIVFTVIYGEAVDLEKLVPLFCGIKAENDFLW